MKNEMMEMEIPKTVEIQIELLRLDGSAQTQLSRQALVQKYAAMD